MRLLIELSCFFAKFQITLVSVLMDMAVVPRMVEDDVDDPHRMMMLAKVHPIPSCASARGVSVESGVRGKRRTFPQARDVNSRFKRSPQRALAQL
jgi:hypothetical protein